MPQVSKKSSETGNLSQSAAKTNGKDSAKDSPKQPAKSKKKDEETKVEETVSDVRTFMKEVVQEYRKITWPERNQIIRETYSVLFLVTVITLMVLAFDWSVGHFIFNPLEHWARMNGGGIGHG